MKMSHKKQHSRNASKHIEFSMNVDKFGNLSLTAVLGDASKTVSHIAEHTVEKLKKKLSQELLAQNR
jgi:hypothetical protein